MSCLSILCGTALLVHTQSIHIDSDEKPNNTNIGLSVQGSSWQAGAFYNSFNLPSVYAAYRWEILPDRLYGLAGGISGYKFQDKRLYGSKHSVVLLVAAELKIMERVSIHYLGTALNLTLQF